MSADIWLETPDGDRLDFDYQMPAVQNVSNVHYGNNFNLTYNLTPMLSAAGMPAWKEFIGQYASDAGDWWSFTLTELLAQPIKYKGMNPVNGWGSYDQAVEVLTALVIACREHPQAVVGGWL